MLKNPKLAWMFSNCYPNTIDTTVHYRIQDGEDDTFVYTGDIHAMWLRDSAAQVWPYLQLAKKDKQLQKMLRGTILRQLKCINIDPYANVPSLLAMGYLGDIELNDPIYQNTRNFVWSKDNPYFFSGTAGEGIGGPHIGYDMVWPMSIMMKAFTSQDDEEIKKCIKMLMDTDADTGFMHESFHKNNPANFTREWFAWQNTLFGELIVKLINDGKIDLLNSIN